MILLSAFSSAVQSWASLYADHAGLRTAVVFAHIGGLVIGGGAAISADRATLVACRGEADLRSRHLTALGRTHRLVVVALGVIIASGLLQFASDTGTFLHSTVFWIKMAMVAVLLANGGWLIQCERGAAFPDARSQAGWQNLRRASIFSMALWLAITLAGAALLNS